MTDRNLEEAIHITEAYIEMMGQVDRDYTGVGFPAENTPRPDQRASEARVVWSHLTGVNLLEPTHGTPGLGVAQLAAERAWGEAIPSEVAAALSMTPEAN